jgi:microsomal dipeptidase-like Zn-dependent dipeptidase
VPVTPLQRLLLARAQYLQRLEALRVAIHSNPAGHCGKGRKLKDWHAQALADYDAAIEAMLE